MEIGRTRLYFNDVDTVVVRLLRAWVALVLRKGLEPAPMPAHCSTATPSHPDHVQHFLALHSGKGFCWVVL